MRRAVRAESIIVVFVHLVYEWLLSNTRTQSVAYLWRSFVSTHIQTRINVNGLRTHEKLPTKTISIHRLFSRINLTPPKFYRTDEFLLILTFVCCRCCYCCWFRQLVDPLYFDFIYMPSCVFITFVSNFTTNLRVDHVFTHKSIPQQNRNKKINRKIKSMARKTCFLRGAYNMLFLPTFLFLRYFHY